MRQALSVVICCLVTTSFGIAPKADELNAIAERYARLVLALGQHDADYVDAFYGSADWKTQAEKEKKSLEAIAAGSKELGARLEKENAKGETLSAKPGQAEKSKSKNNAATQPRTAAATEEAKKSDPMDCCAPDSKKLKDERTASPLVESSKTNQKADSDMLKLRREYLQKQISALSARVRMLKGETLKFDDESRALYDAVAPTYEDSHFDDIIKRLEAKIPGQGELWKRYEEWRKPFMIPKDKLDAVFQAAIKECRARTLAHLALPPNESFTVEYVTNKPWGGYNWYKGNYHSVIQVNTDLPIFIDRAVDLAAHEGYPGHHVYNSLLEKNLVRDRGWVEFSVYALFSPQSLIAEGTANFGREVAFPNQADRMKFEKEVLFPAAGIDPSRADEYYAVQDLFKDLDYAVNEAARRLINGEIDENAAAQWLQKYAVMEPARAQQRLKFIQKYRSYVINYNLGEDMVKHYIEKRAGDDPEKKWSEFGKLLASPRLPSGLQ